MRFNLTNIVDFVIIIILVLMNAIGYFKGEITMGEALIVTTLLMLFAQKATK